MLVKIVPTQCLGKVSHGSHYVRDHLVQNKHYCQQNLNNLSPSESALLSRYPRFQVPQCKDVRRLGFDWLREHLNMPIPIFIYLPIIYEPLSDELAYTIPDNTKFTNIANTGRTLRNI